MEVRNKIYNGNDLSACEAADSVRTCFKTSIKSDTDRSATLSGQSAMMTCQSAKPLTVSKLQPKNSIKTSIKSDTDRSATLSGQKYNNRK